MLQHVSHVAFNMLTMLCEQSADKKARNMEFAAEWEKQKVQSSH